MNLDEFKKELRPLINRHSLDNDCNTPDFVLAEYLTNCLHAYYSSMVRSGRLRFESEPIPTVELKRDISKFQRKINEMRDETIKRTQFKDIVCQKCGHVTETNALSGAVRFPIECPNCNE